MVVMLRGLEAKIESSTEAKNMLLASRGYVLVDCAHADYESCGFKHWHPYASKSSKFTGYNLLGVALSLIRRQQV